MAIPQETSPFLLLQENISYRSAGDENISNLRINDKDCEYREEKCSLKKLILKVSLSKTFDNY
jgi:hypothetical protein